VTISEYLSGARPVVGTIGACGLMLLACSWFVLGPGDVGRSRGVGTPAPVRIGDVTEARASGAARAPRIVKPRPRVVPMRRHATTERRPGRKPHSGVAAVVQSPSPATASPVAPFPAAVPATPDAPVAQQAPELPQVVLTPPAPPVDVPEVTLPPISVPVAPALPQLGLP
jgi:hypothetical protein